MPSGERVKDFDYPELYVVKILKIHQLNIIKIINKDYEKCSRKISKSFEIRKRKKQQCGHEQDKNLPENEKEKLDGYRKNIMK